MSVFLKEDPSLGAAKSEPGNVRAEFQALTAGCGVYSLESRAKIVVRSGDRVRWLNGMVSNNIRDLAPGHGAYAFLLNAQGHVQADLYAFNLGDSLLVDIERARKEDVLRIFDHYIIADDVELGEFTEKGAAAGLTGPESRAVLTRAGIEVPNLGYLHFAEVRWRHIPVTLVHSGEEVKDSWQLWVAPEHAADLWDTLIAAGATPTGSEALNLFRIARGIPWFGQDIRERDLPQETGQMRALSFTKGCYIGQEIVERIRARGAVHRQFTAFRVDGPLPGAGAKIHAGGKEVGEITSTAMLPLAQGDTAVALGYLRREATNKDLQAGGAGLKIASLPID